MGSPLADVLAELAQRSGMEPSKVSMIYSGINDLAGMRSQNEGFMRQGVAHFDSISWKKASGLLLPHECAMLYTASATQTLGTASYTTLTGWDAESATSKTFSAGLKADPTNGRIYLAGIAPGSLVLIVAVAYFAAHATGVRGVKWLSNDATERRVEMLPTNAVGNTPFVTLVHPRIVESDDTYYYLQAYQSSGGNLACGPGNLFFVARLR